MTNISITELTANIKPSDNISLERRSICYNGVSLPMSTKSCLRIYGYDSPTFEHAAALNVFQRQSKIFARIHILEL